MSEQVLDAMDLERERGITIKAKAVRMQYTPQDGQEYELNLIDTPGHVDFTYEVSRSLAACEGAMLVVDAAQGVEAQTLANVYLAVEHGLEIVPVINKIDLPNADPERVAHEVEEVVGLRARNPPGLGQARRRRADILEAIVQQIPPPKGDPDAPLRALVFDSHYDAYKGVIAYVRVVDGRGRATASRSWPPARRRPSKSGTFAPEAVLTDDCWPARSGTSSRPQGRARAPGRRHDDHGRPARHRAAARLPQPKPMVFRPLPDRGRRLTAREALEKLRLNDASLLYEPESSVALGFGFRCGFLGMLHMEIVRERLEREYGLDLLITAPSVEYHVT